jgi:septum formation protein
MDKITLASASPRRRELLGCLGITDFDIVPSSFDEGSVKPAPMRELVCLTASGKAQDVYNKVGGTVIAADTLVFLDDVPLGKPKDTADAKRMLTLLSGRTHQVATGLAVIKDGKLITHAEVTDVRFATMTDAEIDWYVSTGEPMDKAGAYGIQGLGSRFIEGIKGDYFNVVGLPVCALYNILKEL